MAAGLGVCSAYRNGRFQPSRLARPSCTLERTPERRIIDIRHIDGVFTPINQFFTTQHMVIRKLTGPPTGCGSLVW